MSETSTPHTDGSLEGSVVQPHKEDGGSQFFSGDVTMLILTWVTFILLFVILKKYAFKPILQGLEAREQHIRESVEKADQIKKELESIKGQQEQILNEAYAKAKTVLDEARHSAIESAKVIERKAKEEAQIMLQNARSEIKAETERAQAQLKAEVADLTIKLAGKLVEENIDSDKNRKLVTQYIKEI